MTPNTHHPLIVTAVTQPCSYTLRVAVSGGD